MEEQHLRVGIVGCGRAARIHLERLQAIDGVEIVGFADTDRDSAREMADHIGTAGQVPVFAEHRELLTQRSPQVLAIFTPHRSHYRPAMDALQAGCHVFIEKPLSTNAQEAADIVNLARGRGLKVGVGHQYRLLPSLAEARRRVTGGALGPIRLVTATLAAPWLASHSAAEDSWRLDPKVSGGGILADSGDQLLDTLLWTTGQAAVEVAAIQSRLENGLDTVTAATIRLADGIPAALAVCGIAADWTFELTYFGERGRLRATDRVLGEGDESVSLPTPDPAETIDGNFIAAIRGGCELCCPAEAAMDTVRLLEAIGRSATTGQLVRLA